MKYWIIAGVAALVLFLTQCVSSNGKVCLFGMRDGTRNLETTWGTSDRVALSSSELKKQTQIAQRKSEEYVHEVYKIANLYCENRNGFYPDEKVVEKAKELATIYVNGAWSVTQIDDLRFALKENATPILLARILEMAGLYREQLADYCDKDIKPKVPEELKKTLFSHYMHEAGFIWFAPAVPAKYCKTVLG